jgi:hypothetical protein
MPQKGRHSATLSNPSSLRLANQIARAQGAPDDDSRDLVRQE